MTPPVVTGATPSRPTDANGWYRSPLQVAFFGTDETSGLDGCTLGHVRRSGRVIRLRHRHVPGPGRQRQRRPSAFGLRYDATPPSRSTASTPTPGDGMVRLAVGGRRRVGRRGVALARAAKARRRAWSTAGTDGSARRPPTCATAAATTTGCSPSTRPATWRCARSRRRPAAGCSRPPTAHRSTGRRRCAGPTCAAPLLQRPALPRDGRKVLSAWPGKAAASSSSGRGASKATGSG